MQQATPGKLFIISAPTGGGKTTLVHRVLQQLTDTHQLQKVITFTTRPARHNERDGIDYHFITPEAFRAKESAGFFIETTTYDGYSYGSPHAVLDSLKKGVSYILVTDRPGAKHIKQLYPAAILVWIGVPSIQAVCERLQKRGREDAEALQKRMAMAADEINAEEHEHLFDFHLINDNLEKTPQQLAQLIASSLASS